MKLVISKFLDYFHEKKKRNSYKYFVNISSFAIQLGIRCRYQINDCGGVFRTQSNVNYFCKKAPSQIFDCVLNTPQDQAIIKRYYHHDFLSISEHRKCCKNDHVFCYEKIILKKHWLTLKLSYIFLLTLDNLE